MIEQLIVRLKDQARKLRDMLELGDLSYTVPGQGGDDQKGADMLTRLAFEKSAGSSRVGAMQKCRRTKLHARSH